MLLGINRFKTSQQNLIKERINQRELLFQTIVDIVNNKEIQRIILKSQMSQGIFPTSDVPVITKNQIRQMYFLGLILSKVISKSRIQSMIGKYQFNNQEVEQEISTVIEKDKLLNTEIIQLQTSDCDCENENAIGWRFPVICILLFPLWIVAAILVIITHYGIPPDFVYYFAEGMAFIGRTLNCFWDITPPNLLGE
jgi:hypothetical protein